MQKSIGSIVGKVLRKPLGYTVADMKDHARAAIFLNDFSEAPAAARALRDRREFQGESTIEEPLNQFGYRGLALTTAMGDGINAEVQLHTQASWRLKQITDRIYRKYRGYWFRGELRLPPELRFQRDTERSAKLWTSFWERSRRAPGKRRPQP